MTHPMTNPVADAMVEAATTAFDLAMQEMKQCPRCNGRGYHHGFGEAGHDPDWCAECGGTAWVSMRTDAEIMEAALSAALSVMPAGEVIRREHDMLVKVQSCLLTMASSTDMTRPAMREGALELHNEINAALAATPSPPPSPTGAAAVQPASVAGWRTIDSAPKDGDTEIIATNDTIQDGFAQVVYWNNEGRWKVKDAGISYDPTFFTHWIPIPSLAAAPAPPASPDVRGVLEALSHGEFVMSEPYLSGWRVIIGFSTLGAAQDALEAIANIKALSTHPAPDASTTPPAQPPADAMRMREALQKIERWHGEFPDDDDFYPGSGEQRDYMREIARAALSPVPQPAEGK